MNKRFNMLVNSLQLFNATSLMFIHGNIYKDVVLRIIIHRFIYMLRNDLKPLMQLQ